MKEPVQANLKKCRFLLIGFYCIHTKCRVQCGIFGSVLSGETSFESRQELLARLPSLTSLNGSPVSTQKGVAIKYVCKL